MKVTSINFDNCAIVGCYSSLGALKESVVRIQTCEQSDHNLVLALSVFVVQLWPCHCIPHPVFLREYMTAILILKTLLAD